MMDTPKGYSFTQLVTGVADYMALPCLVAVLAANYLWWSSPLEGQSTTPSRHQLALDAGSALAVSVSYAHRVAAAPILVGVRAGYAFELNGNTFDREVWDVLHAEAFLRYQLRDVIQADVGVSVAGSSPADDTDERRTFYGTYGALMVGYRYVFFGPQIRVGAIEEQFGSIANFVMRLEFPFGGS